MEILLSLLAFATMKSRVLRYMSERDLNTSLHAVITHCWRKEYKHAIIVHLDCLIIVHSVSFYCVLYFIQS